MPYIGAGVQRFNTADNLTVSGTSELKNNVTVTGDVTASGTVLPTGDTASGDAAAIGFTSAEGLILTGQGSTSDITVKNDADTTVFTVPTGTDDISFPDNAAILMGAGNDLKIFHNGSNSQINDLSTGNLQLLSNGAGVDVLKTDGEVMAKFITDGAVELYHDNSKKFETTSTGVDVTGIAVTDGLTSSAALDVTTSTHANASVFKSTGNTQLFLQDTDASSDDQFWGLQVSGGDFNILTCDDDRSGGFVTPLTIAQAGDATFTGVVKFADGSESAPAITFNNDTNTGFYRTGTDKLGFVTGGVERMRITDLGRIEFEVPTNQTGSLQDQRLDWRNENNAGIMASIGVVREADGNAPGALVFRTSTNVDSASNSSDGEISEKMRIASNGEVLIGKTSATFSSPGFHFNADPDQLSITTNQNTPLRLNRVNNDGTMISFQGDGSEEGTISISGGTVALNGGHLSRWSRLLDGSKPSTILKGTVMSNLNDMIVWSHEAQEATYYKRGDDLMITPDICYEEGDTLPDGKEIGDLKTAAVYAKVGDEKTPAIDAYNEDNEQLNHTKVSDAEGDINVAGVFVAWDDRDNYNDFYLAMTGDMVIRIAKDTTVERGNLLMSAGDGTAKPQGDGYVQDKTIAKVTSTTKSHTYDDGSYLVPCVLMAC